MNTEQKQPAPKDYIGIRVTRTEKTRLEDIAEREGRTLSQLCRRALQQFIRRRVNGDSE